MRAAHPIGLACHGARAPAKVYISNGLYSICPHLNGIGKAN
jgi:hypothetical protein